MAKLALWLGLLIPLAFSTVGPTRSGGEILRSPFTASAVLRGLAPLACLLVALALTHVRVRPLSRLELLLGVYLAVVGASAIWSIVPWATVLKAFSLINAYLLILALVRLHEMRHEESLVSLATYIHVFNLATAAGLVIAPHRAMVRLIPVDPTLRLSGVFPTIHPDFVGLYAAIGIVLVLSKVGPAWTRIKLVALSLLSLYTALLLLSRARTALVLLVIAIAMLAPTFWSRRPRLLRPTRVAVVSIMLFALVCGSGAVLFRSSLVQFIVRAENARTFLTLTGRTLTWADAMAKWRTRPVLGFGYYSAHRFGLPPRPGVDPADLDNMWIETLLDVGILGFVPLIVFVGAAGSIFLRPSREFADPDLPVRRALFASGLVGSFVNPSMETTGYAMLVMALVIFGAPKLVSISGATHDWRGRPNVIAEGKLSKHASDPNS